MRRVKFLALILVLPLISIPSIAGCAPCGFVYDSGVFTNLNYPGARWTEPFGINDSGDFVGTYAIGPHSYGFLCSGGMFSSFGSPDSSGLGVNNLGQIVGAYNAGGFDRGFLYEGGVYRNIDYPGAQETIPFGINDVGQIAGTYRDGSGVHGFIDSGGVFSSVNYPGAFGMRYLALTMLVRLSDTH